MHEWFWPSSMASCNPAKPTATSALRDQAGAPCGRRLHAREIAETMTGWGLLREYWGATGTAALEAARWA